MKKVMVAKKNGKPVAAAKMTHNPYTGSTKIKVAKKKK